ncbi:MAG: tRNA pseudouridine(55) synthase TruB [Clostridia bacterium]|nr:tRNA pseudouridine(55) synthase TruB [Clostridia bacterium]
MDGILNVYKPAGMTSFAVVARVKKFCSTKRIGHAGTLDPMATGVLPLLIGKAAVMQEKLSDHNKTYIAGIRLGIATDTGDVTGRIIQSCDTVNITDLEFENAAKAFVGKIKQIPPMYSAIQIDGKRLYDLARQGIEVERQSREIEIFSLDVLSRQSVTDFIINVSCSKGTYIRTLCEDIGKKLGVPACMYSLERTVCGSFKKEDSVDLDKLEKLYLDGKSKEIEKLLIPAQSLFSHLPQVTLPEFYTKLCLNGCEIYISKLGIKEEFFKEGTCRVYSFDKRFIGQGELKDYPDGKAIRIKYRFI